MSAGTATVEKRWTYEDYLRLDDEHRYEVIEGKLIMAPAPDTSHQRSVRELLFVITHFVREKKLSEVFVAPIDVVLDSKNIVQPDLVFVATEHSNIIERRGIMGTPDLVVEVISPSTIEKDRYTKKANYARFGVKEYWLADPANRSVEILVLKGQDYALFSTASEKGKVCSQLLSGLEFEVEAVF